MEVLIDASPWIAALGQVILSMAVMLLAITIKRHLDYHMAMLERKANHEPHSHVGR